MKLYHVTSYARFCSISRSGLDPAFSEGKAPLVWLASKSKIEWGFLHVVKRHRVKLTDVVVIGFDVPRSWVRRSAKRGLWNSPRLIPAGRITSVQTFSDVAKSPLEV